MIVWRPWLPVAASLVILTGTLVALTRTASPTIVLPALPAGVHVDAPTIAELRVEPAHPLFAPSRSNAPTGRDLAATLSAPLPILTGIANGGGRALAVVKDQKGTSAILHVGDAVDGWTVRTIAAHEVTFERSGESHVVPLIFGPPAPTGPGSVATPAAATPQPNPEH